MEGEFASQDLDVRKNVAAKLSNIYNERVPIIVDQKKGTTLGKIPQQKLLIPEHYFVGHILKHVRQSLDLDEDKTIFLYANAKTLLKVDAVLSDTWSKYKNDDGFLYISYTEVPTFG